jgi:hypothetical protein
MSQTSSFSKAQNPDFVYLDLQQSNVYNNTKGEDVDVAFIETRDSPVIANTGEYHMSVTRFQIDSYNLPTLVVEPDLTQGNVNETVYKVAIMTESATQLNSGSTNPTVAVTLSTVTASTTNNKFGSTVAYAEDIGMAVIGAPTDLAGVGGVYISNLNNTTPSSSALSRRNTDNITGLGQSVAATRDGDTVVSLRRNGTTGAPSVLQYLCWKRGNRGAFENPVIGDCFNDAQTVTTADNVISISQSGIAYLNTVNVIHCGFPSIKRNYIYGINSAGERLWLSEVDDLPRQPLSQYGAAVAISQNALVIAIGNPATITSLATDFGLRVMEYTGNTFQWIARLDYSPGVGRVTGSVVAMSGDGRFIVSGGPTDNGNLGRVDIIKKTAANTWTYQQTLYGTILGGKFGQTVAISDNGLVLTVGFGSSAPTHNAYIYVRDDDSTAFDYANYRGTATSADIVVTNSMVTNSTGTRLLMGYGPASGTGKVVFQSFNPFTPYPHYIDYLPAALKNVASVSSVMWIPNPIYTPLDLNLLTGKNTVESPYYWCNSYDYFCGLVNTALEEASAANYNYLYDQWITLGATSNTTKGIFFNAAYKSFPTPPFLDWENETLKASMFVNQCYNKFLAPNYAVPPITWTDPSGGTGTVAPPPPFTFKVALNPALYALFNSFPATETLLTTTTGTVEKFYVLNINSSGYPLVTPFPAIQRTLYSSYVFNSLIYSTTTFAYTLLNQPDAGISYSYAGHFIQVHQELSTIDTWCPVNGIVFTTNTLPIVTNQFSSNSVINSNRPSFETGAEYALIITDLQTNEQGYKPNLLYNPTAEYRRVDMTGNRGLTNIDIRVFWRAKTGQLIPFKLSSGVSASIKLLFQKKILGEKQQMQLAQTIRELDL